MDDQPFLFFQLKTSPYRRRMHLLTNIRTTNNTKLKTQMKVLISITLSVLTCVIRDRSIHARCLTSVSPSWDVSISNKTVFNSKTKNKIVDIKILNCKNYINNINLIWFNLSFTDYCYLPG